MFSFNYFSFKKWLILTVFLFAITFLLAYFTGLTGETKQGLVSSSSLIRRAITALAVGLFISFMNNEWKPGSDRNHTLEEEPKL